MKKKTKIVKAFVRYCLGGCGYIKTVPKRLKARRGEIFIPCTITYNLPL